MIFNELRLIEKLYIISSAITSVGSITLGLFVFLKNVKKNVNFVYLLTSLSVFVWSSALVLCQLSPDIDQALFWNRVLHFGSIFIPITFFHFVVELLGIYKQQGKVLKTGYCIALLFCLFLFTNLFINGLHAKYDFRIWPVPGKIYPFFMLYHNFYATYSLWIVFLYFKKAKGIIREQLKWILIGVSIAFLGGGTNYLYFYNIPFPPIGNIFVFLYIVFLAYSIIKYRLMDIRVVFTKVGIFLTVYTLVLGFPIWLGFKLLGNGLWLMPVTFMGILATVGPFIYLFIQKKAENRILQEQHRYQATLRQASAGMGKIKDLKKLLNMIVYVLRSAVQIEHALIYIHSKAQKKYILGASEMKSEQRTQFAEIIDDNSPLVSHFLENKDSIVFEEIKQKVRDFKSDQLRQLEQVIASLNGELLLPIFTDQNLAAIIVMGKKESGKPYSEDDLAVFGILANQTALAIENAQFYEDMQLTQQQLFQAEKMATIGTMADGLSHQINNRFHALGFIAGDAIDTIQMNKQKELTQDKMKEIFVELERAFVRVQDNVVQGGEVVQGLLRYTRKGESGFVPVDVDAVLKAAIEMVQFKIKIHELKIIRDYDVATIPKVKGNFTQLQEVFFNLIDNGYDAMMQRLNEKKEAGYQPTLTVRISKEDSYAQIIFEDNGIGVKDDDMHKLFTPFFTTKLSSKKGTGLGIYVIKKIVEDNHTGEVQMVSKYMHGTQMKLRLPIAIG